MKTKHRSPKGKTKAIALALALCGLLPLCSFSPYFQLLPANGGRVEMSAQQLARYQGLHLHFDDFDFDAKCKIRSFKVVYVPQRRDPQMVTVHGADFNVNAKRLIYAAGRGDIYFFDDIKADCPGDCATRRINNLVVEIK